MKNFVIINERKTYEWIAVAVEWSVMIKRQFFDNIEIMNMDSEIEELKKWRFSSFRRAKILVI